ncbi:Type 1 glutamine amidotransferase-like domain-containing protein [Dinghuibacter silviterrae]|uniref:Dipeptidase E n=1 Tax=Dinghuibacter silviterrae TaxID=1539049 RepID=A0A4R8DUU3_9BACT|nr:Type 1 glutamine amidotransferase-like domain-containing protein [Dinghuibacter silviterrae]TDX02170.1 dipeptidase E [Dinghuibacter silviterrae]
MTKLLLTSSGISNKSIENALVQLLGKPISESNALFVPTGVYPFMGGPNYAWWPIAGKMKGALVDLGWKTMGLFEFTALPSIKKDIWVSSLEDADALLVWGGDPLYLAYWFEQAGLTEVLTSLLNKNLVYVGVSAGSMAVGVIFGETYSNPRGGSGTPLTMENVVFNTGEGEISRTFITGKGAGLTDFAVIPHFNNPHFPDACGPNAEKWAAKIPRAVYAIDDQTAIKVVAGQVDIVSEGQWKFFSKPA